MHAERSEKAEGTDVFCIKYAKVVSWDIDGNHLLAKHLFPHRNRPLVARFREECVYAGIRHRFPRICWKFIPLLRAKVYRAEWSLEGMSTLRRIVIDERVGSIAHLLLYQRHGAG